MKKTSFILVITLLTLSTAYPVFAQDSTSGPTSVAPIEIEEDTKICPVGCTCNGETTNCPIDPKTCPVGCVCYDNGLIACPMQNNPVQTQINSTGPESVISTATPVSIILDKNEAGQITIKDNEVEATSSEKIKVVENKLLIENLEGQYSEVKIMPETASKTAITRLGEVQNVQIELKQTGGESSKKPIYTVTGEKEVKILGLFKVKMAVSSEISAENGEVVRVQRPWWSFLAW